MSVLETDPGPPIPCRVELSEVRADHPRRFPASERSSPREAVTPEERLEWIGATPEEAVAVVIAAVAVLDYARALGSIGTGGWHRETAEDVLEAVATSPRRWRQLAGVTLDLVRRVAVGGTLPGIPSESSPRVHASCTARNTKSRKFNGR